MSTQDFIDLLIVVTWMYGNGFISAWFLASLGACRRSHLRTLETRFFARKSASVRFRRRF